MAKPLNKGSLLLMAGGEHGGKGKGDPILAKFISMCFQKPPRVMYIGAASDDDPYYYSVIEPVLLASGASEVFLANFDRSPSSEKRIASADLAFISGGDVESGMANLEAAGAIKTLISLYKGGLPFVGVSAGSIMMGKAWVHWSDPDDDSTASLFPCLGFADFICDTHDEFDDWGELKTAISISPAGETGHGIPTGGAILIEPRHSKAALGHPAATLISNGKAAIRADNLHCKSHSEK